MNTKFDFKTQLASYQEEIDAVIEEYVVTCQNETLQEYGENSRLALDAFLEILQRGGKRIRGALLLHAYRMSGGQDDELARRAALAVEMMHAYILIIDDIQDRSAVRRDGPTAHKILEQHHQSKELAGDSYHFGISLALNGALAGAHLANTILAELHTDEQIRLQISSLLNNTMVTTAHGQTSDILNEVVASVSAADVERVLDWKTAHYTIESPLRIGAVLACDERPELHENIRKYAKAAGRTFQITDDILGTFGSEFESGKSPMDDTREGKRTLITIYALEHAESGDKNFILEKLGDEHISPAEFERFKQIIEQCGALSHARTEARMSAENAIESADEFNEFWPEEGGAFLAQLAQTLLDRKA